MSKTSADVDEPIMTEGASAVLLTILAQLFREAETLGRDGQLDPKTLPDYHSSQA